MSISIWQALLAGAALFVLGVILGVLLEGKPRRPREVRDFLDPSVKPRRVGS